MKVTARRWYIIFDWDVGYVCPFNWIRDKDLRYWGYMSDVYDGVKHHSFGFWFFNMSWIL